MAFEFKEGDLLVKIGTTIFGRIVCSNPMRSMYSMELIGDDVAYKYDMPAWLVERDFVLVNRRG